MKYYAVLKGRETGIFTTWSECEKRVKGFSGATFKSFPTKSEAQRYLGQEPVMTAEENQQLDELDNYAFTDGSFDQYQNISGWGYVLKLKGQPISEFSGVVSTAPQSRQVAGELAAAMYAIMDALEANEKSLTIYHDYIGVERWATGKWSASKEVSTRYVDFIAALPEDFELKFVHVPAHSGVPLNERADRLARNALGLD